MSVTIARGTSRVLDCIRHDCQWQLASGNYTQRIDHDHHQDIVVVPASAALRVVDGTPMMLVPLTAARDDGSTCGALQHWHVPVPRDDSESDGHRDTVTLVVPAAHDDASASGIATRRRTCQRHTIIPCQYHGSASATAVCHAVSGTLRYTGKRQRRHWHSTMLEPLQRHTTDGDSVMLVTLDDHHAMIMVHWQH